MQINSKEQTLWASPLLLCLALLSLFLSSCDSSTASIQQNKKTINSTSLQQITYSTDAHEVLVRTLYGGGVYGTLELAPQISIYGDGSYILGLDQQGKLKTDELQHLLSTLVDTYGLLNLKHQQFSDIPDQNATFLELSLNGSQHELMYGSFGNQLESAQDTDEYQRLGKALTVITEALKGPSHPYTNDTTALLVRETFSPNLKATQSFYHPDLHLDQIATFECGVLPKDFDPNKEIACLKYTIPTNAILITTIQAQEIQQSLDGATTGTLNEAGAYYEVRLRPLLPDEQSKKVLVMFGSEQENYKPVPLHQGPPPVR